MAIKLNEKSLFFAPMEGITDEYYRQVIFEKYPDWDFMACDFLRIPSSGSYPEKHVIKHFGEQTFLDKNQAQKTIYQVLASSNSLISEHVQMIHNLGFHWLDLNLGCPSKTVCKNKGGSYLLSDLPELRKIIKTIRANFPGIFTTKIRVGYKDDTNFEAILKLLEEEGVEAITIHARTREELYKGVANWDYVKEAVKLVNIPIIGNGDIWSLEDIERYYDYTGAHSVMLARGALKTPWIAKLYKDGVRQETLEFRLENVTQYFKFLYEEFAKTNLEELSKIRRLKSVCRNIFDPFPENEKIKKSFLLSKSSTEMFDVLHNIQI